MTPTPVFGSISAVFAGGLSGVQRAGVNPCVGTDPTGTRSTSASGPRRGERVVDNVMAAYTHKYVSVGFTITQEVLQDQLRRALFPPLRERVKQDNPHWYRLYTRAIYAARKERRDATRPAKTS